MTNVCLILLVNFYPFSYVASLSLTRTEMPQPQVKAPREFKFVGGPSRKRRCRTGPGPAPRSGRPAPGHPKSRPTSPQPTINVASQAVTAAGSTSVSSAVPAAITGSFGVASRDRSDRGSPPHSLLSPSEQEHDGPPGRLSNSSTTSGAINASLTAAPGPSVTAAAIAGPTPNPARVDSAIPALQHSNHYDGIETSSFLDWPSEDHMDGSTIDGVGVSASTTNLFSPFDSMFQMPFFPTPDQLLQDPVDLSGRSGFATNPVSNTQGHKDLIDNVDEADPADTGEPSHVDDQDSPVFGNGLSGTGSSDSTESIDRNDDSFIPAAPVIGNISEKFSRLFEQCKSIDRRYIYLSLIRMNRRWARESAMISYLLTNAPR